MYTGADTLSVRVAQQWFERFRSGVVEVNDAPRSGTPAVVNVDKIMENIEIDRHVSSRNIAQKLNINHQTVLNHLQKPRFKKKSSMFGSHTS